MAEAETNTETKQPTKEELAHNAKTFIAGMYGKEPPPELENKTKEAETKEVETKETTTQQTETQKTETQETETQEVETKEEKKAEPKKVIKTPLASFETQPDEEIKVDIEKFDEFSETIKNRYGIELKEQKDILGVFDKVKDLEKNLSETKTQLKKGNDYITFFESLPNDVKTIVVDAFENKDYKQTIKSLASNEGFDYTKEVNAYKTEDLIKRYNPNYTDEDFEDLDDKHKTALYNSSVALYNSERDKFLNRDKEFKDNLTAYYKSFDKSIEVGSSKLKEQFPTLTEEQHQKIISMAKEGYGNEIFNRDGTYKEDALVKMAIAEYAPETINTLMDSLKEEHKQMVSQEVSKEKEILSQARNDTVTPQKTEKQEDLLKKEVSKATAHLKKKSPF